MKHVLSRRLSRPSLAMDLSPALLCLLLFVVCLGRSSDAYIEKVLENDSVCSMNFLSNNLNLIGREEESAMVIKDSRYFQQWTGKHEFNCRFTVTSSLGLGIFAVIQRMSFRRNAQGQCIDYVQFRHTEKTLNFGELHLKFKTSEPWSSKICGKVNELEVDIDDESNNNSNDENKAVVNSFIDHRGLVEVKLHLGNKSIENDEELSFEIVFTAFQECTYDNGLWKSCGSRTCIYKKFFQDGKLNCPYKSCKDEGSCYPVISVNGNGDRFNTTFGTRILAGTVAGLFTMFVAFIAFLWLFRHCGTVFCCMGHPNSHPHSSEMQPVPHLDTMAMPSAPPDAIVVSGTDIRSADKDLPPSYESLFPSK